jgi:hypothetical protein
MANRTLKKRTRRVRSEKHNSPQWSRILTDIIELLNDEGLAVASDLSEGAYWRRVFKFGCAFKIEVEAKNVLCCRTPIIYDEALSIRLSDVACPDENWIKVEFRFNYLDEEDDPKCQIWKRSTWSRKMRLFDKLLRGCELPDTAASVDEKDAALDKAKMLIRLVIIKARLITAT